MEFNSIWQILKDRGRVAHFYRSECEYLWSRISDEDQQAIFDSIERKINSGRFVHYNPANAIRDNMPHVRRQLQLSYADYYRIYGTTEERDGWKMANPTGQKVIYVKSA